MNIRIVAEADIGSFIAVGPEGNYFVLTLDDIKDIELGDVLSGTFDDDGSSPYSVKNTTEQEDVQIVLEALECSADMAIKHLLEFMRAKPGVIFVGGKRFSSDMKDIAHQIRSEILKS